MSATNGESIAFGQTLSVPAQSRWIRTGRMKHICVSALGRSTNVFLACEYNLRISRKVPLSYHAVTFKIFLLWFSSLHCTLHMFFTFSPNTQRSAFPISIFIMHELARRESWEVRTGECSSYRTRVTFTISIQIFFFSSIETICRNDFRDECKTAHINISYI